MANELSLPKGRYNFGGGSGYRELDMDADEIISGEDHLAQEGSKLLNVFTKTLKKQQEDIDEASNQSQFELAKAKAMHSFNEYQVRIRDPGTGMKHGDMVPGLMTMSQMLYEQTEGGIEDTIKKSEYQSWFNQEVARQKLTVGTQALGTKLTETQGVLELVLDDAVKRRDFGKIYELTTAAQSVWGKELGINKIQAYLDKAKVEQVYFNVDNMGGFVAVSDALQDGDQSVFKDAQGNWLVGGAKRATLQGSFYDLAVDNINKNNRQQADRDEEVGVQFVDACASDSGSAECGVMVDQLQKNKIGISFTMTKRLLDWFRDPAIHDNPQAIGNYNELFFNVKEPISNDDLKQILLKYVREKLITSTTYGEELEKLKTRDPNRVADESERMIGEIYDGLEEQTRSTMTYLTSGNYILDKDDPDYNEIWKSVNDSVLASIMKQSKERALILSRVRAKRDANPNITSEMLLGFAIMEMSRTDSFSFIDDEQQVDKAMGTFEWRAFFGGVVKEYGVRNLDDVTKFRKNQMDALGRTVYDSKVYSIPVDKFLELDREQLLEPETIGYTPDVPLLEVSKTVDLGTLFEGSSTINLKTITHEGKSFAYKTVYLTGPRTIRAGAPTVSFSYYDSVAQETTLSNEDRIRLNKNAPLVLTGARQVKIKGGGTEVWGRVHLSGNVRELVGFTGTREQWRGMDVRDIPADFPIAGLMTDVPYYNGEKGLTHVNSVYSRVGEDSKYAEITGNGVRSAFNKIKNKTYWILLTKGKDGGQEWYVSDDLSP